MVGGLRGWSREDESLGALQDGMVYENRVNTAQTDMETRYLSHRRHSQRDSISLALGMVAL